MSAVHNTERPTPPASETYHVSVTYRGSAFPSHFMIDDRGELVETVETCLDGTPDWEFAAVCDPVRGDDPALQEAVLVVLRLLDGYDAVDRSLAAASAGRPTTHLAEMMDPGDELRDVFDEGGTR